MKTYRMVAISVYVCQGILDQTVKQVRCRHWEERRTMIRSQLEALVLNTTLMHDRINRAREIEPHMNCLKGVAIPGLQFNISNYLKYVYSGNG